MTGTARQAQPPHARVLGMVEAARVGLEPEGTCGWGGCWGETVAMRWDYRGGRYREVCAGCRASAGQASGP